MSEDEVRIVDSTEAPSLAARPPAGFEDLRSLLIARGPDLPKRLAQVATFAMANPDEMAFGTAASIAEAAAVQPSTLVRFSQSLGLSGFSELQAIFRNRLRDRALSYEDRLAHLRARGETADEPLSLFQGFADAAIRSLQAAQRRLAEADFAGAVARLAPADTIYLLGQRRSFPITSYMSYAFGKLGVKNILVGSESGIEPEMISFASPNDAAIAISFTPYASDTIVQARAVAERGCPLVVITDSPFSPLIAEGRIWFEVVEADHEGFRSLAATMVLATTLTVAVAENRRQFQK